MKNSAVILVTNTKNEIDRFLTTYFKTKMNIDENTFKWTCLYENPLNSIDLISVCTDNIEDYNLEVLLQLDRNILIKISDRNINEVIKFLYERYK